MAIAQLAGEGFLVGLDRYRAGAGVELHDRGGAGPLVRWGQWRAVETGIGDIHAAMLAALPAARAAALCDEVTIDLDTTDVEVYGRQKRGMA
jgi:hypothetical protein